MRIVYVTSTMPYGSGEAFIMPEIEELKRQGHEVLLVPMYPRGKLFHDKAKAMLAFTRSQPLLSWEVFVRALLTWAKAPYKALSILAMLLWRSNSVRIKAKNFSVYPKGLWLASVAKEWQADHIHAHWAATTATMAWVASEMSGVPWSFTAHRWDIAENNLISLKARKAAFARAIDRRGAQELASCASLVGWAPHVIHMGVVLQTNGASVCVRAPRKTVRAVMAANFIEKKGHLYLVEAMRLLSDRNIPIVLDLAGNGSLRDAIEHQVRASGLGGVMNFLGQVPHDQLLAQLHTGTWDVMVLPSIEDSTGAREGIPVSLMEAMSCGIPVISTYTGGISELLEGGAGVLVPPKDSVALADAIECLAKDLELREQLQINGRRRVQEQFDIKQVAARMSELFVGCRRAQK